MRVCSKSRRIIVLCLMLGLALASLQLHGHLVPAGDNATYIVLGQSVAAGHGYRMISDPRMPNMALYPPGYPMVLAGLLLLTRNVYSLPSAIVPMKLLSVALFLTVLVLSYHLFSRRSLVSGLLTACMLAVNPHLLYYANEVGTEMPYLLLSLLSIHVFQRYWRYGKPVHLVVTAALLGLTFYIRSIALVLAAAFVLFLLARRRWMPALLLTSVVGLMAAPWLLYSSSLPNTGTSVGLGRGYFALYFSSDPYGTANASLTDWVSRIAQNTSIYARDIWPEVIFAHAPRIATSLGALGNAFLIGLAVMIVVGWALEVQRSDVTEWYVLLFFASCLGYLWAQSRLIVPIIPFAAFYFLRALEMLLRWLARQTRAHLAFLLPLATCLLVVSALVADFRAIGRNLQYSLGKPVDSYYSLDLEWGNYLQAIRWVEAEADESAIVMCRKPDLLYVLINRRALEYPYSSDGTELAQSVYNHQVTHLIEDAFTWTGTTSQYFRPALLDWQHQEPAALRLAMVTEAPRTRVWRVADQTTGE